MNTSTARDSWIKPSFTFLCSYTYLPHVPCPCLFAPIFVLFSFEKVGIQEQAALVLEERDGDSWCHFNFYLVSQYAI